AAHLADGGARGAEDHGLGHGLQALLTVGGKLREIENASGAAIVPEIVQVTSTTQAGGRTDADTVAVGVFEGEDPPADTPAEVGELLRSGEARRSPKSLALTHVQGRRWLVVGLGERAQLTPERVRAVAAAVHARALEIG